MFTNNVRDLPVGGGHRTGMCDIKGRLVGLMDLYATGPSANGEAVLLVLEGVTPGEFEERYGKYIVFDDVEMSDLTPQTGLLTLQGPDAAGVLARAGLPEPATGILLKGEVAVLRKERVGEVGFDILVPRTEADALSASLIAAGAVPATFEHLELRRVEAGIVRWPVDMPGRVFPPELGLRDEILHFEKGCYIGQEVINRIDVMGELRRDLVGVRVEGELPKADWEIRIGGKAVGKLTSPMLSPTHGWIGLAVVRKPHDAPGTEVMLVSDDMTAGATIAELPFSGPTPLA